MKTRYTDDTNPQCIDNIVLISASIVNCHFGRKKADISIPHGGIFVTYASSFFGCNCEANVNLFRGPLPIDKILL